MKTIIKGADATLTLKMRNPTTLDPYDLTGATEITVCFKADDGTVEYLLTASEVTIVGAPDKGDMSVAMSDAKTILMSSGNPVDFDLIIDKGANRDTFVVEQSLIIKDRNC